jgi:8-oxo-dGTP pyrophosphatase MutT (NUDIX family)
MSEPRPTSDRGSPWDPTATPAATVVVVRDARGGGLEVLMLRRDRDLSFAGGTWVFPGGRLDDRDLRGGRPGPASVAEALSAGHADVLEAAARRAAVREAAEEAGLRLEPTALSAWSHWTPPPQSPKRYTTAFFVAALPDGADEVVVDDSEIREHRWLPPAEVLERRDRSELTLTPPTFITLEQLRPHHDVAAVLATAGARTPEHFSTRICVDGEEVVALYHGDAGYADGRLVPDGPRHRLRMGHRWVYERSG